MKCGHRGWRTGVSSRASPSRLAPNRFRHIRWLRGAGRWGRNPRIEADRSSVRAQWRRTGRGDSAPAASTRLRSPTRTHERQSSPAKPRPAVELWPELDSPRWAGSCLELPPRTAVGPAGASAGLAARRRSHEAARTLREPLRAGPAWSCAARSAPGPDTNTQSRERIGPRRGEVTTAPRLCSGRPRLEEVGRSS